MTELPKIIKQHLNQLTALCNQFGVLRLYAFGSVLTNNFDPIKSDLDFKVDLEEMSPLVRGENLMNLWDALEALFSKKVDLITDQPIKNAFLRENIEQSKQLIYDRAGQEVFS